MSYEFDELTPEVVRNVGFRERYRGYDPIDVDPLLDELAHTVADVREELSRLERSAAYPRRAKNSPPVENVAALAALLHIGFAAREARDIVLTARRRTGLSRAKAERQITNEERARALLYRPTSVD